MAYAPVQAAPASPPEVALPPSESTGTSGWFGARVAGVLSRLSEGRASHATPDRSSDIRLGSYARLQLRLTLITSCLAALAVLVTALVAGPSTAASVFAGSLAGLLYLRLLARSVGRLGGDAGGKARSMGRVQLLVPVVLVLATARIPQLQMLPALLGFLIYKPVLFLPFVHDS